MTEPRPDPEAPAGAAPHPQQEENVNEDNDLTRVCGEWPLEVPLTAERNKPVPQAAKLPNPPAHLINLAVEVSGWSPCRSKRGVVIFYGENVVTHGYNYKPRGFDCDGSETCKATCRTTAVHAEQQALLSAGRQAAGAEMLHVKSVDGKLVPSGGPSCVQCSKLALVAGITGMWLYHVDGWRRYETADWYRQAIAAAAVARLPPQLQQSEHMEEAEMDDLRYLDVVQNPPVGGLFHWRDGFCFQRTKLGAVVMTLPDKSQKVIPPHEWASIVAYLSHAGETEETFRAALAFHGEPV